MKSQSVRRSHHASPGTPDVSRANSSRDGIAVLRVLKNHGFRALWIGQLFSQLAANSLLFVLALQVYQLTGSNAAVSGLFLVYSASAVVFGIAAGTIVDKLDNRLVLILCDIVRAVLTLGFLLFPENIIFIYVITFFNAIVTQFYVPSEAPTIPRLVPQDQLVTANSLFTFTYFSSLAIGSILAGPLLRVFGPVYIYYVLIFLFLLAAISVSRIPRFEKVGSINRILSMSFMTLLLRVLKNMEEAVSYVRHSHVLFEALLLLTGTQVIFALLGTLGPGFADRVLGIDVRDASILITGPVVAGIILGALWVGNIGYMVSSRLLINTGILSAGLLLVIISLSVRLTNISSLSFLFTYQFVLVFEILLFFLLGIANSLLDVPANTILQTEANGPMRGRVYGMMTAAVGGLGMVPVVAGGILADTIGVGKVILIVGLLITLYGVRRIHYNSTIAVSH